MQPTVFFLVQVRHKNYVGDYARAYKASVRTESLVMSTYRFSAVFYIILGALFLVLILAVILVGIRVAHTGSI